jgi:hypothetical protein
MNTDEHRFEKRYLTAGTDRVAGPFGEWFSSAGHENDRAQVAFYLCPSVSICGSSLALEKQ